MLENMKNRRTIRKYTTQDIPDALLNELLEVAARASNTGNMQYTCRKDEAGKKLDKAAMLVCSKALGHNRISVVADNYIRGL